MDHNDNHMNQYQPNQMSASVMNDINDKYHNNCDGCNDIVETIIECVLLEPSNDVVDDIGPRSTATPTAITMETFAMIDECAAVSTLQMSSNDNSQQEIQYQNRQLQDEHQQQLSSFNNEWAGVDLQSDTSYNASNDAQNVVTTVVAIPTTKQPTAITVDNGCRDCDCEAAKKPTDVDRGETDFERFKKTSSVNLSVVAKDSFICRICHNNNQVERYDDHSFLCLFSQGIILGAFFVLSFNFGFFVPLFLVRHHNNCGYCCYWCLPCGAFV